MGTKFQNQYAVEWAIEKAKQHDSDDCLIWPFAVNQFGYGRARLRSPKREMFVHRAVFIALNGDPGDGMNILHRCDNPPCFNPRHLFIGTFRDNTQDMISKGRFSPPPHYRGEKHGMSKLTAEQVIQIRALAGKELHREIAARFGVHKSLVGLVIARKIWTHI